MRLLYHVLKPILCSAVMLLAAACEPEARGFALPVGDAERGQASFVLLQCNQCHYVQGKVAQVEDDTQPISVRLGGTTTRVRTYGDLVTSIINPSHRLPAGDNPVLRTEDGGSAMRAYNDVMTVAQLVDLTTFLQAEYSVWVPSYSPYAFP